MQKVAFARLLTEAAGLGLNVAHESTIRMLDEQLVTLDVSDELAERLVARAGALGGKCCLE